VTADELLADLSARDAVVAAAASEGYAAGWLTPTALAVLVCGLHEGHGLAMDYVASCERRWRADGAATARRQVERP
jgi:hypothetical protein